MVLRSAMLPFHGDPSFWLLTFRCINTEGLNSRRAASGSHRKNCGGWGVRNPSQVQHLLGFVTHPSLELLIRGLLKFFQVYLFMGGVWTSGGQATLFLEEISYVGSGSLIPDLIYTAGPWDPAPSQDIRAKPSGNAD